jgi:hypothetical protein
MTIDEAATKYGAEYYKKDKPANTYTFHEGFKAGANWMSDQQKQQIIQVIEDRIADLENDPMDIITKTAKIEELKNTLKLIK